MINGRIFKRKQTQDIFEYYECRYQIITHLSFIEMIQNNAKNSFFLKIFLLRQLAMNYIVKQNQYLFNIFFTD